MLGLSPWERGARIKLLLTSRLEPLSLVAIQTSFLQGEHDVSPRAIDAPNGFMFRKTVPGIIGDILTKLRLLGGREVLGSNLNRRHLVPRGILLIPSNQRVFDRLLVRL